MMRGVLTTQSTVRKINKFYIHMIAWLSVTNDYDHILAMLHG